MLIRQQLEVAERGLFLHTLYSCRATIMDVAISELVSRHFSEFAVSATDQEDERMNVDTVEFASVYILEI